MGGGANWVTTCVNAAEGFATRTRAGGTSSAKSGGTSTALARQAWALAAAGLAGYALWLLGGALVRDGNWLGVDFQVYYQAAKVLGRGENIYAAGISPPYVYPPLLAVLVYPLSLLQIGPATILWKAFQHICLMAAGLLLTRMSPASVRPPVAGVLLIGLLLVPVRDEIVVGESNSLILALVVGAVALVGNGARGGAGAAQRRRNPTCGRRAFRRELLRRRRPSG